MSSNNEKKIISDNNQEILEKYNRESAIRTLSDFRAIIDTILVLFSLFQLYSVWHVIPSTHMRPIHLSIVVSMAFILYPGSKRKKEKNSIPWYDLLLALAALVVYLYPVFAFKSMINQFGYTRLQIIIGITGILLLLEACRRVVGLPIVLISIVFVCFGLFGRFLPGVLRNRGFTIQQIVQHLYYTQEGVFGTPVGASSTFIFLFILFGSFLEKTGVGAFFVDLSNSICGSRRGGPAKVAVVTSALMGTVSGSSVANTVGSGSFTIPMMKKLGYKPEFAAAVEASASTGGQIMPPVMGAAAFLMAENLGVPFGAVIKAAIIPAILYFTGIYFVTDLEAKKLGLVGQPKEQLPLFRNVIREKGFLILPIIAIIMFLILGYSASFAALLGIVLSIVGSYIPTIVLLIKKTDEKNKPCWAKIIKTTSGLHGRDYLEALSSGARSIISVSLACGVAGIIVGMITKTGIGLKLGAGLTALANGNLILLLVLTMFASILLGMGVPTTPNYLITSTIMAPIIYKAVIEFLPGVYDSLASLGEGYALLPAHFFAFYFGIIADITPPVALAAMAGAAIAKADPLKSGINASKLAIAGFLVPYIFVLNPQLLMLNAAWYDVFQIIATSLLGMLGIGICIEKYWRKHLNIVQQVLALAGGLALIYPGTMTDIVGIALIGTVFLWQRT